MGRSRAREIVLQALYQHDLLGGLADRALEGFIAGRCPEAADAAYARRLVGLCRAHGADIDQAIRGAAENWDLRRMAVVDRNILRLALGELLYMEEIPPKVAINEAINLAKRFSTAQSGAFVNGILDRIVRRSGRLEAVAGGEENGEDDGGG